MMLERDHITVCICTFKRPDLLAGLLKALENQKTDGLFTYSAVVADNDPARSAEPVADQAHGTTTFAVKYCSEPRQNIALARNQAVQHAEGNLVAFIDDDEVPLQDWLYRLYKARADYGAAGVLGPVKPRFVSEPPSWVIRGGFFNRPSYPSGYRLTWTETRTGNVLFLRSILNGVELPFDPKFATAGEDMDFFRRMMDKGFTFVWCDEAPAYELVPASRCQRRYLLKRALLRGSNFRKHPAGRLKSLVKSLIAVPCYAVILPIVLLLGQHVFLKYLIKFLDHSSRILSFAGLALVTERTT